MHPICITYVNKPSKMASLELNIVINIPLSRMAHLFPSVNKLSLYSEMAHLISSVYITWTAWAE